MDIKGTLSQLQERFYNKITDSNFIKKCILLVMAIYFPLLIIGVIVAYLGPANYIPLLPDFIFKRSSIRWDRYTIWTHWISDLGSFRYSPAPYLYDIAAIIAGIFTLPLSFYLENLLAPLSNSPRWKLRLSSIGWLSSIIGNIGYIGVGIFSEDRSYFGLHGITSAMAFGGFTFGSLFMGVLMITYNTKFPKLLGIYGVVGPLLTLILYSIFESPIWEWMLLFSIIAWIIPLSLIIIRKGG